MFKDLKQFFLDLQDKSAGQKISQWPVKIPLLLYTKLFAVLVAIVTLTFIYSLVYFVPQIPKIISENLPDVTVSIADGILSIDPSDPIKLISPEGSFVIDTRDKPDDYSVYPVGVFVYRSHSEMRDQNGVSQRYEFQNLPDFSLSKKQAVDWFSSHKAKIVVLGVLAIVLISLIVSLFIWGLWVAGFYFISWIIFWLFRLFRRRLRFSQIVPVVVYASILPLLISYVLFFAPHPLLNLLNLALFLYFTAAWLLPLAGKTAGVKKSVKKK